mgnify:CR=1 FL=1
MWSAWLWGAAVGLLGGLLGLGGAEFRLPVLVRVLGYGVREAIPLNLTVSQVTLLAALAARLAALPPGTLSGLEAPILGLAAGGVAASLGGAGLVRRLPARVLERWVRGLLCGIGLLLVGEGLAGLEAGRGLWARSWPVQLPVACALGLAVGLVSSLLGVAGGELLIPILVLVFGAGIKAAGTASVLVSAPVVAAGLWRYRTLRLLGDRAALRRVVLPMALGSLAGAVAGGWLAASTPTAILKVLLGLLLIGSAARAFPRHGKEGERAR